MQAFWILLVSAVVTYFFVIGVPIFLVIGFWVIGVSFVIDFTLANLGVTLFEGLNFFGLLALPLFILTGDLIKGAGIAKRLSEFAYSVLGWLRGGLGMASLGACGLFAAISGSNSATTATIGSIMHPEMTRGGYDKNFAAATVAAGGTVGIIIPPSIIFIVYGFLMNLSISDLFIGGLLPGVLMIVAMQFICWLICQLNGWGHLITIDLQRILKTAIGAWIGFGAIILVIWGIYSGKFSPTEAAGVTAGVCTIVGLLFYPIYQYLHYNDTSAVKRACIGWAGFAVLAVAIGYIFTSFDSPTEAGGVTVLLCGAVVFSVYWFYRRPQLAAASATKDAASGADAGGDAGAETGELPSLSKEMEALPPAAEEYSDKTGYGERVIIPGFSLWELPNLIMRSGQITGVLAPLIAISVVMQQILTLLGAKEFFTDFVGGMGGYYGVLFVCMAIVLLAGTILESLPNTIIFAPILAPIAAQFGIDPIHFAVVFLIGDAIGFITPPYGLNLYVASGITGIPYFRLLYYTMPYFIALMIVWIVVALVPDLSTILLVHEGAGTFQK